MNKINIEKETLQEEAERIKEETAYEEGINTIEEAKAENIFLAIDKSRQHPGVSLENIAVICAKVFDKVEMEKFIGELQQEFEVLYNSCEKCGGELGRKMVGDEIYDTCIDCGRVKH